MVVSKSSHNISLVVGWLEVKAFDHFHTALQTRHSRINRSRNNSEGPRRLTILRYPRSRDDVAVKDQQLPKTLKCIPARGDGDRYHEVSQLKFAKGRRKLASCSIESSTSKVDGLAIVVAFIQTCFWWLPLCRRLYRGILLWAPQLGTRDREHVPQSSQRPSNGLPLLDPSAHVRYP